MNLYVVKSNKNSSLSKENIKRGYIYNIGSTEISDKKLINVNDSIELDKIAEETRDNYCDWIADLNDHFIKNKIHQKGISLYFLTNVSSKRTEFLNSFNHICNVIQIKRIISRYKINKIILHTDDYYFYLIVKKNFKEIDLSFLFINKKKSVLSHISINLLKDFLFFFKIFFISLSNIFLKKNYSKKYEKFFLTRFPLHFKESYDIEDKYGPLDSKNENYLVHLLTDNIHQNLNFFEYFKYKKICKIKGYFILDEYLSSKNTLNFLINLFIFYPRWFFAIENRKYIFKNIDVSELLKFELRSSFSQSLRLLLWIEPTKNFFKYNETNSLTYYLHEYPYGRLFSFILRNINNVCSIGMQHGPASWRKLVYFMSKSEVSSKNNNLKYVPIPDRVLAEDEETRKIYSHSNYSNITVMDEIFRIKYLKKIIQKEKINHLIAPGLHDGEFLLKKMSKIMNQFPNDHFILKPHPRGNNEYIKKFSQKNLLISSDHISDLLPNAKKVYVTYSSVGNEAKWLNIELEVMNIPGIVSQNF